MAKFYPTEHVYLGRNEIKIMNQILMTENKTKKKKHIGFSGTIDIGNIVKFFAIAIITFAVFIIGHSSYALYRDTKSSNMDNLPEINIKRINDTLIIDVKSLNIIEKFRYNWANSDEKAIPEGAKNFQEQIILPSEDSVLYITLEDETGRAIMYSKDVVLTGIDIAKPKISIEKQSTSIRVTAEDETEIEYLTYRIDDGDEIKIDKNNDGDKKIQYAITEIGRGEHTIYVTAVDSSGNTETEEKKIIVSTEEPQITELSLDRENHKIVIGAADADGIQSIEVNLNGKLYNMNNINKTEAKFTLSIVDGKNTLSIKITNVNGLSAEGATEFNYAK